MKAILIKHLSCTNKRGARLKACTDAGVIIESRNNLEPHEQAKLLAQRYLSFFKWDNCKISGFGTLPNGDYVATLE